MWFASLKLLMKKVVDLVDIVKELCIIARATVSVG